MPNVTSETIENDDLAAFSSCCCWSPDGKTPSRWRTEKLQNCTPKMPNVTCETHRKWWFWLLFLVAVAVAAAAVAVAVVVVVDGFCVHNLSALTRSPLRWPGSADILQVPACIRSCHLANSIPWCLSYVYVCIYIYIASSSMHSILSLSELHAAVVSSRCAEKIACELIPFVVAFEPFAW